MALKPDRKITDGTDISFYCNQLNEKGAVMVFDTVGSGAAMDDNTAVVKRPTVLNGSGEVVAGILLCDVVSGDLTKTHLNAQRDEVQVGSKVTLLRRGWITTNMISGTVTKGHGAYPAGADGTGTLQSLAPTTVGAFSVSSAIPRVGTWLSTKDSDGYAKLEVNLI